MSGGALNCTHSLFQLEEEERQRIEGVKEMERKRTTKELEHWKEQQRAKAEQVSCLSLFFGVIDSLNLCKTVPSLTSVIMSKYLISFTVSKIIVHLCIYCRHHTHSKYGIYCYYTQIRLIDSPVFKLLIVIFIF